MANSVIFDGIGDYLLRGDDLTGNADSKLFLMSFWFRRASTGSQNMVWRSAGSNIRIRFNITTNEFNLRFRTSGGSTICDIQTSAITDTANFHHIACSFDLADINKRHLYVDAVSDLNVNTYTDNTIGFTATDHGIGATEVGANLYDGELAEFWAAPGQYLDLSVSANLEKFRGATGCAQSLGSDGSTPTGTAPLIYFTGPTSTWHINSGSGGGFTEVGALADGGQITDCVSAFQAAWAKQSNIGAGFVHTA